MQHLKKVAFTLYPFVFLILNTSKTFALEIKKKRYKNIATRKFFNRQNQTFENFPKISEIQVYSYFYFLAKRKTLSPTALKQWSTIPRYTI